MSKLLNNELFKEYLNTLKERIANGVIVGTKNANGTYTASVSAYDLAEFCKDNDIDFAKSLETVGFQKSVGSYSYNEINKLAKDYTYGTDTEGIQVELILAEYMRQQIVMCMNKNAIHNKLVARSIPVDSQDVRITFQNKIEKGSVELLNVAEGAELPKLTNLGFGTELLTLGKVGGELEFTYELLKSTKINLLGIHYRAIAVNYDLTKDTNVINVLINGHAVQGGANTGRGGVITTSIPAISTQNLLPIKKYFAEYGVNLKYAVMNLKTFRELLGVEEFTTPLLVNTAISGETTPIVGFEVEICEALADNKILAVDPTQAVEEYVFTPFMSESDKNIHNQTNSVTFSEISGYALVNPNAGVLITVDADATYEIPAIKEPVANN